MDFLVRLEGTNGKRAQIERQLRAAIVSGRLAAHARVPPSRVLAEQIGVSRGTVLEAYGQLAAEGYLIGRRGDGTRVNAGLDGGEPRRRSPTPAGRSVRFDLRSGLVDAAGFPRQAWSSATADALRSLPDAAFVARHRGGFAPLREALASRLAMSRATRAAPDQVVITSGLAYGLSVVLGVLRERGARRVAVEDPAWPLHADAVAAAGLERVGVYVDAGGIDVDELDRTDADAVVVTPAHQYPTGVVLSPGRRSALLAWARRRGTVVIEDDYDAEYRYDAEPVASLQGLAPDRVVYLGTASKSLVPTLRIGWVLAPGPLAEPIERANARFGAWPPLTEQAALASFIERGHLARHLRAGRRRYRARRDVLVDALDAELGVQVNGVAAGLHLVAWLPAAVDEHRVLDQARDRGVALHGVHRHSALTAPRPPGLLIGYGGCDTSGLSAAVRILGRLPALAGAVNAG